tara:strand:+ start:8291 stop:10273 length:1983 start_codon:yes stop_codon:yes gene_type:complete
VSVGHVALNGDIGYALKPFRDGDWVKREQIAEEKDYVSPLRFGPFTGGIGRNRILATDADNPREYLRTRDATADTRWRVATLPILEVDLTHTGLEILCDSVEWQAKLWALWTDDSGTDVVARSLSTTTWGGGGTVIATAVTSVGLSVLPYKQHLVALCASGVSHLTRYSADGVTWTAPTGGEITSGLLASTVDADDMFFSDGLLVEIGGELVAAVYHEDNRTITFFSTTDMTAGTVWTDEGIDIPSGAGVNGLVVYPDIDSADKLYVFTDNGIWMIDTAPATWTFRQVFSMPRNSFNGIRATVHQGAIWFPYGAATNQAAAIASLEVQGDARIVTHGLGLDAGDGVVAESLGRVRWMKSAGERLYIAVGGGAASRHGRVFCRTSIDPRDGWHSVRRHGTANQELYWVDLDAADICYAVYTGTDTSDAKQLQNGDVDPQTGISISYEEDGYIDLPYIDGGKPTINAAWLRASIDAADLTAGSGGSGGAGDEYVDATHGVNDAARTTTDLGDFLSGQLTLDYASGAGASGRNDGIRLDLQRSTTATNTPGVRSLDVEYVKQPGVRDRYTFQVDLEATVQLGETTEHGNVEGVITTLEAARDLATLPTFMYANLNGGTDIYVKVRDIKWGESIEVTGGDRPTAPSADAQRTGIAVVTVEREIR